MDALSEKLHPCCRKTFSNASDALVLYLINAAGSVWLGAIVNTLIFNVTSVAGCTTIVNF